MKVAKLKKALKLQNRKGQITFTIFVLFFVITMVAFAMVYGGLVIFFQQFGEGLNQNVTLGNVNLADIYADTGGKAIDGFVNHADEIGLGILLSMTISLILGAYIIRTGVSRAFIIVDLILIIIAVIVASYVSNLYNLIITTAPAGSLFDVYTTVLSNTSRFILNLPFITAVWGVLVMVATHIKLNRGSESSVQGI